MATPYAFVTLVTSDFYLPGALALVAALRDLHPSPPTPPEVEFQTICLVTPETVDVSSIKLLRHAFDVVIGVEIIEQEDDRKLRLLGKSPFSVRRQQSVYTRGAHRNADGPPILRSLQNSTRFCRILLRLGAAEPTGHAAGRAAPFSCGLPPS